MKVYSLYHKDTFVASFPTREEAIDFGKSNGGDPWDYDVIVEYLSKSPLVFTPPHYTSLTPITTVPCNPGVTLIPGKPQTNPGTYPDIYCGVKAND